MSRCPGGSTMCINEELLCDGTPDCPDEGDEDDELCGKKNFPFQVVIRLQHSANKPYVCP